LVEILFEDLGGEGKDSFKALNFELDEEFK